MRFNEKCKNMIIGHNYIKQQQQVRPHNIFFVSRSFSTTTTPPDQE